MEDRLDKLRSRNEGFKDNSHNCITCITIAAITWDDTIQEPKKEEVMTVLIPQRISTIEDCEAILGNLVVCCDVISIFNEDYKKELETKWNETPYEGSFQIPHLLDRDTLAKRFEKEGTTLSLSLGSVKFIYEEHCHDGKLTSSWRVVTTGDTDEEVITRSEPGQPQVPSSSS